MATENEFTRFHREDVVFDDGCSECGKETDAPLVYVNREDPEYVIHEECFYDLVRRERDNFIHLRDVPSGKLTASEKVDAMIGESLDEEEYELDEPVEFDVLPRETAKKVILADYESGESRP